jgi:hypothetical protein
MPLAPQTRVGPPSLVSQPPASYGEAVPSPV